jgi:hypothetical protein
VAGPQRVSHLLDALAAAGDQDEVVAALGELARELLADARRGAGDENGRLGVGWKAHAGCLSPREPPYGAVQLVDQVQAGAGQSPTTTSRACRGSRR